MQVLDGGSNPLSFLLASRCLNVMSAQALLMAFKLHEIIQLPVETLAAAVPQVPTHSLQVGYRTRALRDMQASCKSGSGVMVPINANPRCSRHCCSTDKPWAPSQQPCIFPWDGARQ